MCLCYYSLGAVIAQELKLVWFIIWGKRFCAQNARRCKLTKTVVRFSWLELSKTDDVFSNALFLFGVVKQLIAKYSPRCENLYSHGSCAVSWPSCSWGLSSGYSPNLSYTVSLWMFDWDISKRWPQPTNTWRRFLLSDSLPSSKILL